LTLNAPTAGTGFGAAVAISATRIVVSAGGELNSSGVVAGAVFVYDLVGGSWQQTAKLTAPGGAQSDYFGSSLALDGNRVFVGAPGFASGVGAVYIFDYGTSGWQLTTTLQPSPGPTTLSFGDSLAADGVNLLVGAPHSTNGTLTSAGAVHAFQCTSTGCTLSDVLQSTAPRQDQYFGWSVALSGSQAVIGAPNDPVLTGTQGSADWFARSNGHWQQMFEATGDAGFGAAVAINGNRAVVGSYLANNDLLRPGPHGSANIYQWQSSSWTLSDTANPVPTTDFNYVAFDFGHCVALDSSTLVVGNYLTDWSAPASGKPTLSVFRLAAPASVPALGPFALSGLALALLGAGVSLGRRRSRYTTRVA
jgi:hypothetical protein